MIAPTTTNSAAATAYAIPILTSRGSIDSIEGGEVVAKARPTRSVAVSVPAQAAIELKGTATHRVAFRSFI